MLLAATAVTTMTVQVIPSGVPMGALPVCGFYMVEWKQPEEPAMVLVETPGAELTFVGAEECADFEQAWQRMVEAALDPAASRDFVAELIKEQGGLAGAAAERRRRYPAALNSANVAASAPVRELCQSAAAETARRSRWSRTASATKADRLFSRRVLPRRHGSGRALGGRMEIVADFGGERLVVG